MTDIKHTPGPWVVEADRLRAEVFHVVGPSEIVTGLDGICSPHRLNDRTFQEDEANMRLISAAPELFDLLMRVHEAESSHVDTRTAWWEARAAALRKAVGKA